MAHVIAQTEKPTLVLAHNKTLAAQLYAEMRDFFPDNHVEYFVSYYDYYQPEAYVPRTDTFIEKESTINEQIDRMRHSATRAILEHRDVIIVASVSCIYGIGDRETYSKMVIDVEKGMQLKQQDFIKQAVDLQYNRNEIDFSRGRFRVRGDNIEIFPAQFRRLCMAHQFFLVMRWSKSKPLTPSLAEISNHLTISGFMPIHIMLPHALPSIKRLKA